MKKQTNINLLLLLGLLASVLVGIGVFVGGGLGQSDGLYAYTDGGFTASSFTLPATPENTSTYGAVSFDLDNDGNTDLFLSTNTGLYWYKKIF